MAKIVKIGKMWYSDYTQDNRRIKRALSLYKDVAQTMLQDLLKVRKSEKDGSQPSDVSWFYFREKYLKHCKTEKAAGTYYNDRIAVEAIEKYGLPLTRLSQMTPEYMNTFKEKCGKKKLPEKTVIGWMRRIKTAMHWADAWKLAPTVHNWKLVKTPPDAARVAHMDLEMFKKVLAVIRLVRWKTAAMLMGYAGLRSAEVRYLEWKNVDFKDHFIHICAKEITHADGTVELWKPKGVKPGQPRNSKDRKVDMPKVLESYLQSLPDQSGFVLGEFTKRHTYRLYFKRLSKKVGFKVYAHMFRHSYASFLISFGSTLPEVGSLLGHSDARSTQVYTHMLPYARRNAVDRMEKGMQGFGLGAQ